MKRILLSVFAAAITAAWAMPTGATASDVTFGGQYRLRGEQRNQADFNKSLNDHTDMWGQRVRLTANAKATDDTSVKITLQDTRTWGATQSAAGGPGLTDTCGAAVVAGAATSACNATDLHESYVNVDKLLGAPVSLRAGRQELAYGDERLIGSFGWSNNGRSFDALKFVVTTEVANVDLFTSKITENASNLTAKDQDLYGLYATVKAVPSNTVDLYYLSLRDNNGATPIVTNNTTAAATAASTVTRAQKTTVALGSAFGTAIQKTQVLNTYGFRVKGGAVGLDYTLELAHQSGKIQTDAIRYKISANAFALKGGYTIAAPVKIRVGAEYDYASGDKDNSDNKIGTFSNLFPTNHDKMGYMDYQAWRNVKAFNLNLKADVTSAFSLYAGFWNFKLANKHDAWYSAAAWNNTQTGAARAASQTNSNSGVGNEIDIVGSYKYNSALTADLGYGYFKGGKFVKDNVNSVTATATTSAGKNANSNWAYLQLTANF
ncbi:MAG: alginate export family protein [Deltaproteobacteria bacterium]|nr:alginate export family protein [Deltaproteobacteria bacterium]